MRLLGLHALAASAAFALLGACAQTEPVAPGGPAAPAASAPAADSQSILAMSTPAPGSTVNGPVNELMLHFSRPALLGETTVSGPQGTMPMMVTPAGETVHYVLPLPGLGTGTYRVDWKATASGQPYQGSFSFSVR